MPKYDYRCVGCKSLFELEISYDSTEEPECPVCKSKKLVNVIKKIPPVHYKTGGFTKKIKNTGE